MSDEPYTKRELDHFFLELKEQLDRIEGHVSKTNGRVSGLEHWRTFLVGSFTVASAVFGVALNYVLKHV
jgi:hypothetical protein